MVNWILLLMASATKQGDSTGQLEDTNIILHEGNALRGYAAQLLDNTAIQPVKQSIQAR